MTPAEVSEGLGLDTLKNRQWSIFKSCAIKGEGLEEGLDWCVCWFLTTLPVVASRILTSPPAIAPHRTGSRQHCRASEGPPPVVSLSLVPI